MAEKAELQYLGTIKKKGDEEEGPIIYITAGAGKDTDSKMDCRSTVPITMDLSMDDCFIIGSTPVLSDDLWRISWSTCKNIGV